MLKCFAAAMKAIHLLAVASALLLPACSRDGPTASSRIPNVAGTYSGPNVAGTYTGPVDFTEDGVVIATLSMRMNIVQSGSRLTVNGAATFGGESIRLPAITGIVDETGFFTPTSGGDSSLADPDCGTFTATSFTLTFSGNTVRYDEQATTSFCGHLQLSGTLTR
jgi:hypothetical protein